MKDSAWVCMADKYCGDIILSAYAAAAAAAS